MYPYMDLAKKPPKKQKLKQKLLTNWLNFQGFIEKYQVLKRLKGA